MTTRANSSNHAAAAVLSILCLAILGEDASADVRTWNQKEAGTYGWSADNFGGTLPSADDDANFGGLSPNTYRPTGNQTITGDGTAKALDFHNSSELTSRTFTGNITASNFVMRLGIIKVGGVLDLVGTDGTWSLVGAALQNNRPAGVLEIENGATVRASGAHALRVGMRYLGTSKNKAAGRVILRDGGTLILGPSTNSMSGLQLGRAESNTSTSSASYVQEGGHALVGRLIASFDDTAAGNVAVIGGTLDMPRTSNDTRFRVGNKGYGSFQLLGGDVYAVTNYTTDLSTIINRFGTRLFTFEIGQGRSVGNGLKGSYFYACDGTFTTTTDFSISGQNGSDTGTCAPAVATIDGGAVVTARVMRVGANASANAAILNLNGGMLRSDFIFANEGRPGRSEINADGGKIVFSPSSLQQQFLFLDAINVYEGGLEINVERADGVFIGNAGTNVCLRTPTGYGIESIAISNSGKSTIANCLTPPWILLDGGSGDGADAISLVNWNSNEATNIVVTCRGQGYEAGDTVTASILRLDNNTPILDGVTSVVLSENKPGALIKTGGYNLSLFAQPEFEGTYEVRQGFMVQSTAAGVCSPKVKAVVVGGTNDATFQTGSGNNGTAREATWNPINPAATLTLGTEYGPGKLRVPGGADGQPFQQTFASLSVSGTGNVIEPADVASGSRLSFGSISCAAGSSLTIPSSKSSFKVYVTGVNPGTTYPNIHFADKSADVGATVAADGQLVPTPAPVVIVIR